MLYEHPASLVKPTIAEGIGVFLLALTIGVATHVDISALYIPAAIGLAMGLMVIWFGNVSGGHFNPAVTVGLLAVGKVRPLRAVFYLCAQIVGAYLGFRLSEYFTKYYPSYNGPVNAVAFWGELVGAVILVFTMTRLAMEEVSVYIAGPITGAALILAITLAAPTSAGIINPALALSLRILHGSHLLAPLLGGVVGAFLAVWLVPMRKISRN